MNLEGIKLLDHEPDATDAEIDGIVERLIQEAGGWGLRQSDRIILTIARVARDGQEAAAKLDDMYRALKGSQMECGRLKKRLENSELANTELARVLDEATKEAAASNATIESMQREIDRLTSTADSDSI